MKQREVREVLGRRLNPNTMMWEGPGRVRVPEEVMFRVAGPPPRWRGHVLKPWQWAWLWRVADYLAVFAWIFKRRTK